MNAHLQAVPAAPAPSGAEAAFQLAAQGALSVLDLFNAAHALHSADQPRQAIALYRLWLDNSASPIAYAVQFNLGVLYNNEHDDVSAEQAYRAALAQKPDFLEALMNLGSLKERVGQPEEALAQWRAILGAARLDVEADRKLYIQALNNLGRLLEIRKQLREAEELLHLSLSLDPGQVNVMTHWVHLRQKQCEWPVYDSGKGLDVARMVGGTSALAMLSASGDPELQLVAARRYVKEKVLAGVAPLSDKEGYDHARLRIGYLSSDFCSHAVSILTAELFELHDRSKVEVYGFCWSHEDGSPLRARVVGAMDHYVRIGGIGDEEAARLIRQHEIDILIDLHGLTLGTRPNILSHCPAPVQITYLGFPGTTGLPSVDYVLADPFVLPPELTPYFTETPLYLPHCFQINDRQRAIGPRPSKEANGLPEGAFVFCSFNNNFKFTPEVFASWMRILQRVPHGVLWLVVDNDWVRDNLCRRAEEHGIARARLHFAARVAPADYLARYQLADLFLDTYPFGAGTTASDALWAGLPLLTCAGRTFASRMAGSLLLAADLPELVTNNLTDYENKAVALAHDPERLAAMKRQLDENRLTCRLFDSPQFVRDLEQLYDRVACRPGAGPRTAPRRAPGAAARPLSAPSPSAAPPCAFAAPSVSPAGAVLVGPERLKDFDALAAGILFTGWIGKHPMSPERAAALHSIFRDSGRPVVFITDDTLADWQVPGHPFHPAYPLLSEVHKADYLRVYLLHHFGGGYTDIKPVRKPWTAHFAQFNDSDCLALGYPELGPDSVAQLPGELGRQLRAHYAELIGVCCLIFRRRSALTQEWIDNTHRHLDAHLEALRRHPARHPMDHLGVTLPDGAVSAYPLAWTGVGGDQFHPAILKYRHRVRQTADIMPQLHAYR